MTKLALGLELSTQSAKFVVMDADSEEIVYSSSINYDEMFGDRYNISGGVLLNADGKVKQADPLMLIEAIDASFQKMKDEGKFDMNDIKAMKVDGMQHCNTYMNNNLESALADTSIGTDLATKFKQYEVFTRGVAPIWEDASTEAECEELTDLCSSLGGIVSMTGNPAEMRFPAAQYLKWGKEHLDELKKTTKLRILSSLATSILTGIDCPVDTGDGYGSNLNTLDINKPEWDANITNAFDSALGLNQGSLINLLGEMTHYDEVAGKVNSYFVKKYGINVDADVLIATGDNPATMLATGGNRFRSFGSSTTEGDVVPATYVPDGVKNTFGYTKGKLMSLACIGTGGKLHEELVRKYVVKSQTAEIKGEHWQEYQQMALRGGIGDFFMGQDGKIYSVGNERPKHITSDLTPEAEISAAYMTQMAELYFKSGGSQDGKEFCAVGGGADELSRDLAANLFKATSYRIENFNDAAPFGCAISAAKYLKKLSYEQAINKYVKRIDGSEIEPVQKGVEKLQTAIKQVKMVN